MIRRVLCYCLMMLIVIIMACDPTYGISIINESSVEVVLYLRTNNNFSIDSGQEFTSEPGLENSIRLVLPPGDTLRCGMAIGGLKNDLPFEEITIHSGSRIISAKTESQIMKLFDRGSPYYIRVK